MAFIILRDRWRRQPTQPVGIDWSHPFAASLVFAATPTAGPVELVRGSVFSTPLQASGIAPPNISWVTPGSGSGMVVTRPYGITGMQQKTIFALVNLDAAADFETHYIFCANPQFTTGNFRFNTNKNGASKYVGFLARGGSGVSSSAVSTTGTYSACISYKASDASTAFYINGTACGTGDPGAATSIAAEELRIGFYEGASIANCATALVLVFNRALSQAEVVSLHREPWTLFKNARRIYVPSADTGGTTTAEGASTASFALSGSAAGQAAVAGTSTSSFTLSGTATGAVAVEGLSTASFTIAGTSTGTVGNAAATGESTASFTLTGAAAGTVLVAGTSTGAFSVSGTSAGELRVDGASVGAFTLTGSGAGTVATAGQAIGESSAAFTIGGAGTGTVQVDAASTAAFALSGNAAGQIRVDGASAAAFTIAGSGEGTVYETLEGASVGSFDILGSAAGWVISPTTTTETAGGGGWPILEERDERPRRKSTVELTREILDEVDEEMREAVGGEPLEEILARPVDAAAFARRITRKPSMPEDDDDDDILLLSH